MPETSESSPPTQKSLVQWISAKLGTVIVLGILFFLAHQFLKSREKWQDPSPSPAAPAGNHPGNASAVPIAAPPDAPAITAALAHKQARAEAEVRLARFRDKAGQVLREAGELQPLIATWEKRSRELLTNDQGKQIAADPRAAVTFKALLDAPRPGQAFIDRVRDSCSKLLSPVEESLKRPESLMVPNQSNSELDALAREVQQVRDDYSGALTTLDNLIAAGARTGKTSPLTLSEHIEQARAERAAARAMELRKAAEEGEKIAEARELEQLRDLQKRATTARDPDALKLLDFTGVAGSAKPWPAAKAAKAYDMANVFRQYAIADLDARAVNPSYGAFPTEATETYKRLETLAQQQYGLSLYELFRVIVDSEANQKAFTPDDELRRMIKDAQAKGNSEWAATAAKLLDDGNRLPKPKYK